jgi:hypothetical protein
MRKIYYALPIVAFITLSCLKAGEGPALTTDMTPAGACVAGQVLANGVEDPSAILLACVGTTLQSIASVVETLLTYANAAPDSGTSTATAARLTRVLTATTSLQAKAASH